MKKGFSAVLTTLAGAAVGAGAVLKTQKDKMKKEDQLNRKNDAILKLYSQWVSLKQQGKSIADYLKAQDYKTVAIYGMHYMGENLLEELRGSDVEVKYAIDRNAENIFSDVDVLTMNDDLPPVDAVIVTAFYFFDEIEESLAEKLDCPALSIEDILYEM